MLDINMKTKDLRKVKDKLLKRGFLIDEKNKNIATPSKEYLISFQEEINILTKEGFTISQQLF